MGRTNVTSELSFPVGPRKRGIVADLKPFHDLNLRVAQKQVKE